jgi:hypothetical protein
MHANIHIKDSDGDTAEDKAWSVLNYRIAAYLSGRRALEARRAQREKKTGKTAAAVTQSEEEIRQAAVAADAAAARFLQELEAEEQASATLADSGSKKLKKNKNKKKKGHQQGDGGGSSSMSSESEVQNEMRDLPADVAALQDFSIAESTCTTTTTATASAATTAAAAEAPDKEDDEDAFQNFLLETAPDTLICPISHYLFREPVTAQDTHTYELEKLEEWIETCARKGNPLTSPVIGSVMAPGYIRSQGICSMVMEHIEKKTREWKETGGGKKKG